MDLTGELPRHEPEHSAPKRASLEASQGMAVPQDAPPAPAGADSALFAMLRESQHPAAQSPGCLEFSRPTRCIVPAC
eukprot:227014-Alexandrium_andersonii.AAC.1